MSKDDSVGKDSCCSFGIGAMIELPDETVTAGLDFWPSNHNSKPEIQGHEKTLIRDERLEKRLSKLHRHHQIFLSPTEGRKSCEVNTPQNQHMNFFRFPNWVQCPQCNVLKKVTLNAVDVPRCNIPQKQFKNPKDCSTINNYNQRPIMRPVSYMVACKDGHLDDFPWVEWVHRGVKNNTCDGGSGDLYLTSSARNGLSGVYVQCSPGRARESLLAATSKKSLARVMYEGGCSGRKPWLGSEEENDYCTELPQMVQRAQSSIYFPNTVSSILIPPYSKAKNLFFNRRHTLWAQIEDIIGEGGNIINDEFRLKPFAENFIEREAKNLG